MNIRKIIREEIQPSFGSPLYFIMSKDGYYIFNLYNIIPTHDLTFNKMRRIVGSSLYVNYDNVSRWFENMKGWTFDATVGAEYSVGNQLESIGKTMDDFEIVEYYYGMVPRGDNSFLSESEDPWAWAHEVKPIDVGDVYTTETRWIPKTRGESTFEIFDISPDGKWVRFTHHRGGKLHIDDDYMWSINNQTRNNHWDEFGYSQANSTPIERAIHNINTNFWKKLDIPGYLDDHPEEKDKIIKLGTKNLREEVMGISEGDWDWVRNINFEDLLGFLYDESETESSLSTYGYRPESQIITKDGRNYFWLNTNLNKSFDELLYDFIELIEQDVRQWENDYDDEIPKAEEGLDNIIEFRKYTYDKLDNLGYLPPDINEYLGLD